MEGYMSVLEAAAYLGKSKPEVHRLLREGMLEYERLGAEGEHNRPYAIKRESVERRKLENPGRGNPTWGRKTE